MAAPKIRRLTLQITDELYELIERSRKKPLGEMPRWDFIEQILWESPQIIQAQKRYKIERQHRPGRIEDEPEKVTS